MKYEILFLDHGNKVFSRASMEADDDKAAIHHARRIHADGIGSGYHIRRDGVTIHFEEYRPAGSLPYRGQTRNHSSATSPAS